MKKFIYLFITVINSLKYDLLNNFRTYIFIGLANLLPELVFISYLRPILWRLAGVNISIFSLCSIKKNVYLEKPKNITLGRNININRGVIITGHGKVIIEDYVSIAFNAAILTISHKGKKHDIDFCDKVHIKMGSHIGTNAIILQGSIINEYTIISPGCIFSGESHKNFIYVGNPARKIKERDDL